MILGTASGVGKSLLTAGLCRLMARSGVRVAPFKPQNMSNNAAACASGGEIGRAQALQAFACGLEPHVDMNPVLIKPEGDQRAQLVVHGEPRGILEAARFREDRRGLLPLALESFFRLTAEYDWVCVEGAGSPAEPNLRAGDIANLGFAEAAGLDAWLIGDIDRGGVFASLIGTLAILEDRDRSRIKALIVNRFRGSSDLLDGMMDWLSGRAGRPVLGMLPHVADLHLPEEDQPYSWREDRRSNAASIRIAAIEYPTVSNGTDLDALVLDERVEVQLVNRPEALAGVDLVILPGSKSVWRDLGWLRERGFVPALERHLRYGGRVLGICGGMQMLGERILDPAGLEGGGETKGLRLLPVVTELVPEKKTRVIDGLAEWPRPVPIQGYEIHYGRTTVADPRFPFHAVSKDERVWGTYVHGLFDGAPYRDALLATWFDLAATDSEDLRARWRSDLDRMADLMLQNLDLRALERRLGATLR